MSELASRNASSADVPLVRARPIYDAKLAEIFDDYDGLPLERSFRHMHGPLPARDLTHNLYPYPARLLRHIPKLVLASTAFIGADDIVLDPFCGSGTVLVEASRSERPAIGVDANPVAALVSRVKTTRIGALDPERVVDAILRDATFSKPGHIPATFLTKWYRTSALHALARLSAAILRLDESPQADVMRVALALTARAASIRDPRIPVPVRKSELLRDALTGQGVYVRFRAEAIKAFGALRRSQKTLVGDVRVIVGDARVSDTYAGLEYATAMITSPPYGAAQKYVRATSLEAGWLGMTGTKGTVALEGRSIGREHPATLADTALLSTFDNHPVLAEELSRIDALSAVRGAVYRTYFTEMDQSTRAAVETNRGLNKVVLVAGTNVVAGVSMPTHRYLADFYRSYGFAARAVIRDEIRGRSLLTRRSGDVPPAQYEFVYFLERSDG